MSMGFFAWVWGNSSLLYALSVVLLVGSLVCAWWLITKAGRGE